MQKLSNTKGIKCEGKDDQLLLIQNGYFNLVNGYKLPFSSSKDTDGNHIYENGTSIEHLFAVKKFDDKLRLMLFNYIVKIEEEVRTLAGYKFDEVNNRGAIEWFQIEAYNTSRNSNLVIAENISRLMGDIRNSKNAYLKHYRENHDAVPTWILTKVVRFSTFISTLYLSKPKIIKDICKLYGMKQNNGAPHYVLLNGSLHHIRAIRNACAHNERVFDLKSSRKIHCEYFDVLPPSYSRSSNKDKQILDFVIYMRYYLDDVSFNTLIDELYTLLSDLKCSISSSAYDYVRGRMGIKDAEHLLLLKSTSKAIDFLKFC